MDRIDNLVSAGTFRQVTGCSQSDRPGYVRWILESAEHDDRGVRQFQFDSCQAIQSVALGHPHIQQNDVGPVLEGQFQSGFPSRSFGDNADIRLLKQGLQSHADDLVVVGNEQINGHELANLSNRDRLLRSEQSSQTM
jgi:hypothetical protein